MQFKQEMAVLAQTDSIGDYLQQEYGSKPPDTHIECFYIRFGQEIANIQQQQAIDILNDILGPTQWVKQSQDGMESFSLRPQYQQRTPNANMKQK